MTVAAPCLLLVEDDPVGAEWLLHTLRGWGYAVDHALDAARALDSAHPQRHCGLLIDQRLPDGCGETLLAALRARGAKGPALALSADLDPALQMRLAAAGFAASLRKPVEPDVLLACLQAAALAPPAWDEARALAAANGRRSIAHSLRALMLDELPGQRAALLRASRGAQPAADLDGLLHRLQGAARLTGASALAAQVEVARAALLPGSTPARVANALARLDAEIARLLDERGEA